MKTLQPNFSLVTIISSAAIMAALAVSASIVFVSILSTQAENNAPPEHDVKGDLFEAFEAPANAAAASFYSQSKISEKSD